MWLPIRVTVVKYRNCVNNTAYTYLKKSTPPTTKYTSLKPIIVHTKFSFFVPFFFFGTTATPLEHHRQQ